MATKKKFLILMIIQAITLNLYGQNKVAYEVGVGSYRMSDMPLLQDYFKNESEVGLEVTSSFPSYLFYQILYTYSLSKSEFGLGLRYASTGGRLATSDYSGSLAHDQLLQLYSIGISYGGVIAEPTEKMKIGFRWFAYYDLSNLKVKSTLKIGQEEQSEEIGFTSSGFSLLPLLLFDYQLIRPISVFINAGYELNIKNQVFRLKENQDAILSVPDGEISPDWTGYRFSLGIIYAIDAGKK